MTIKPTYENSRPETDKLCQEAKERLANLLDIEDDDAGKDDIDRIIDCMVSATILETSAAMTEALARMSSR